MWIQELSTNQRSDLSVHVSPLLDCSKKKLSRADQRSDLVVFRRKLHTLDQLYGPFDVLPAKLNSGDGADTPGVSIPSY